jgi:hypothetical protein
MREAVRHRVGKPSEGQEIKASKLDGEAREIEGE